MKSYLIDCRACGRRHRTFTESTIDLYHKIIMATCVAEEIEHKIDEEWKNYGYPIKDMVGTANSWRYYAWCMRSELWDRGWLW